MSIDILILWHLSIHWVQQYLFVLNFNQQKSSTKLCGYRPISFGNETLFHLCTLLCISTPQFLNSFTKICTKLTKTIFLLPSQKTLTKCISPVIAEENSLSFFFQTGSPYLILFHFNWQSFRKKYHEVNTLYFFSLQAVKKTYAAEFPMPVIRGTQRICSSLYLFPSGILAGWQNILYIFF